MPSIGFSEIVLILLVILIFVKPEDLPKFLRNLRKLYIMIQQQLGRLNMVTKDTFNELTQVEPPITPDVKHHPEAKSKPRLDSFNSNKNDDINAKDSRT